MPSLQDLKPVQLKELTEAFGAMDSSGQAGGTGKPTRFTRKQAREMEAAASAGIVDDGDDDAGPGKFHDRTKNLE
jgi:cytoskeleton-associated protein 5